MLGRGSAGMTDQDARQGQVPPKYAGNALDEERRRSVLQRVVSAGPQGVMQAAGFVLFLAAAIAFGYGIYFLISIEPPDRSITDVSFVRDVISPHFHIVMIVAIGLI